MKTHLALSCLIVVTVGAAAYGVWHVLDTTDEPVNPPSPQAQRVELPPDTAPPNTESPQAKKPLEGAGHTPPAQMLELTLARLHHEAVHRFLSMDGNGIRRLIVLPEKVAKPWKTPMWSPSELDKETPVEDKSDLAKIHRDSSADFLSPLPVVKRPPIFATDQTKQQWKKKDWEIHTLDLVGLVKHEHPVVYTPETTLEMKKLDKVPTRLLDFFEVAGVKSLQGGEDLFVRGQDGTIRMLGAIRATSECRKCHDSAEGALLGAFSYTLRAAEYRAPKRDERGVPVPTPKQP